MNIEELIDLRRYIHAHPEVSNDEWNTAKLIAEKLSEINTLKVIYPIGETGVVAIHDTGLEGPTVMFRAELDALPIQEENDIKHISTEPNVSHMCGHDGHMTGLLGLAYKLDENPIEKGRIILVFQPGEENGTGAKAILEDPQFDQIGKIDYVFAYHNIPGFPLHQVVVRNNSFTPHVNSLIVRLKGITSHAAEPENGKNPAVAMSKIWMEVLDMHHPNTDSDDFYLITPISTEMGEIAYGISAGEATLRMTMRSWTTDVFNRGSKKVIDIIEKIASDYNLVVNLDWTHEFFANQNDSGAVESIKHAAEKLNLDLIFKDRPFKWGEDFGLFTRKYKGAMFCIGSGEDCPALHNPDYDFPDEILSTGIDMFFHLAKAITKNQ